MHRAGSRAEERSDRQLAKIEDAPAAERERQRRGFAEAHRLKIVEGRIHIEFALKGATLFPLWTGQTHRPTKRLDLLGRGSSSLLTTEKRMNPRRTLKMTFEARRITRPGLNLEEKENLRRSRLFQCTAT
jgi:hypothetical protein